MKRGSTFSKKRFWIVICVLALVEVIALFLIMKWKYIFPSDEVSEIYTQYENEDGIDASYIKKYKVNDSVYVDVTLLEATDSDGWQTLSDDFGITPLEDELQQKIDSGKDLVFVREVNGQNMKVQADSICDNTKLIAISYLKKSVCIFHVADDKEIHSVYYHNFDKTTNKPNF